MGISGDDLERLAILAHRYIGKKVKFDESISRSREVGRHNRHFSTHTHFVFTVENVMVAFSGAQLAFLAAEARYGIALDNVVNFEGDERSLEVVEHFEEKTERRTQIKVI